LRKIQIPNPPLLGLFFLIILCTDLTRQWCHLKLNSLTLMSWKGGLRLPIKRESSWIAIMESSMEVPQKIENTAGGVAQAVRAPA
jgi:hypothetical protein